MTIDRPTPIFSSLGIFVHLRIILWHHLGISGNGQWLYFVFVNNVIMSEKTLFGITRVQIFGNSYFTVTATKLVAYHND